VKHLSSVLLFLALLALLEWGVPLIGVPDYILPRPSQVISAAFDPETRLLRHGALTTIEGLGGLLLGAAGGYLLAIIFVLAPPIEAALYPWVVVSQTIPLVALAPLLIFWFGNGIAPRIALAALFAIFPVLVSAVRGLRDYSREDRELLAIYDASPWQVFLLLRMPSSLPALFSGLKIAATLAVIGAITGELAGASEGLGFAISVAARRLETARSFAAVAAAAGLGLSIHLALVLAERRLVFWRVVGG
jgi:ABC-type nitrate/sulfonate/bicarbonate transport system permease component